MSHFQPRAYSQSKTEVKGSRFIGHLYPVSSREEAEVMVAEVKEKHRDATHNCWAYRIFSDSSGWESRFSDEGEPSGTAGRPILNSLEEKNIAGALLVVTRYFGGSKLGMGGLSRAYRQCARAAIESANLKEKPKLKIYELNFHYGYEPEMRFLLNKSGGELRDSRYEAEVTWKAGIPASGEDEFIKSAQDICRGQLKINPIEEGD